MKLLVREDGTGEVQEAAASASGMGAATLVYAETRAGLVRIVAERRLPAAQVVVARDQLERYWSGFAVVELTRQLAQAAGEMAERHRIRGADAVHLASAFEFGNSGEELRFACWDDRLRKAARDAGLRTLPDR